MRKRGFVLSRTIICLNSNNREQLIFLLKEEIYLCLKVEINPNNYMLDLFVKIISFSLYLRRKDFIARKGNFEISWVAEEKLSTLLSSHWVEEEDVGSCKRGAREWSIAVRKEHEGVDRESFEFPKFTPSGNDEEQWGPFPFRLCLSLLNPESTTAYPCHSSRLFVSTINHSRVSRVSLPHSFSAQIHGRSANVSFVFFRVFFLSCHYYKNEVSEVFTVYFHREWDIFIGKTARHPRYCSALIYFFPFFRPRIFSEIWEFRRNEYVISRYRLHGFYIMQGKRPG